MDKSRVCITDGKVHAIAYAIMNGTDNLRFDKEDYFHVLVFYQLFYKRNLTYFLNIFSVFNTWESLGELPHFYKKAVTPYHRINIQPEVWLRVGAFDVGVLVFS